MHFTLSILFSACAVLWLSCASEPYYAEAPPRQGTIELIVRLDGVGLTHASNLAAADLMQKSLATDFSVVVNTPWFAEAVALFDEHKQKSVGVQLTLTSPSPLYGIRPVHPFSSPTNLISPEGYFYTSFAEVLVNGLDSLETITEFRAQIHKAMAAGLEVGYIHLGEPIALAPAWFRAILEQLAYEFQVGITGYFDERELPLPQGKRFRYIEMAMLDQLNVLSPGRFCIAAQAVARHAEQFAATAEDTARIGYLADINRVLKSDIVAALAAERGIALTSYRDLLVRAGLWRDRVTLKGEK